MPFSNDFTFGFKIDEKEKWEQQLKNPNLIQAGTSCGESSKHDCFLNSILKVRMSRFSRNLRLKCRKSSFREQKHSFWTFLRTEG